MDERNNIDDITKEESQCFVCDAEVKGRYYSLATCRTQYSHSRVIKKLGELVGERYLVVISEDDVICRSCAILFNTLDRLEMEIRNTRDHVLQLIEKKYSLKDGELRGGNDKPKPCQPPQITKSNTKEITSYCTKENDTEVETSSTDKETQERSQLWLQCYKCKYTTHVSSFMMHHFRDHFKQRKFCDKCGVCIFKNQDTKHTCARINEPGNKENEKDHSDTVVRTYLMEPFLEKTQPTLPFTQTTPPPLTSLSNCDHLYISKILPANNPDTVVRTDSMEMFLEKTQPTLPFTQTTPPPLTRLSNCDHLYISKNKNIFPKK